MRCILNNQRARHQHPLSSYARTATHKLVSTPTLDGSRIVTLVSPIDPPDSEPAVEAELRQRLAAFEVELDGRSTPVTDAEPDTVEALRELGYVE